MKYILELNEEDYEKITETFYFLGKIIGKICRQRAEAEQESDERKLQLLNEAIKSTPAPKTSKPKRSKKSNEQ